MADVKWIKIPTDFFLCEPITIIEELPESDAIILLYLHLLCETRKKNRKMVFEIHNLELTDEILSNIFRYSNIGEKLKVLESLGLIKRHKTKIEVFRFWIDKHDRNSMEYRKWRMEVFSRDKFICQNCGTNKELQAHHLKRWKDNKELRYVASNGITLCRSCHLKAHGGRWN